MSLYRVVPVAMRIPRCSIVEYHRMRVCAVADAETERENGSGERAYYKLEFGSFALSTFCARVRAVSGCATLTSNQNSKFRCRSAYNGILRWMGERQFTIVDDT